MGLFDAIERLDTHYERPVSPKPQAQHLPIPPVTATTTLKAPAQKHHQTATEDDSLDIWRPSPAEIEERRRILNRKPEHLSFLAPCPVCHGRSFLHIDGGGFVCRTCTPGLFGYPVEAAGQERPAPILDDDLFMANGPTGEAAPQPENTEAPGLQSVRTEPTAEQQKYFAAAWPWIKENKAVLMAAGWTMVALVRRGIYRWPYGNWGLAWLPVWTRKEVVVTVGSRGEIVFRFQSSEKTITQTAWPERNTARH